MNKYDLLFEQVGKSNQIKAELANVTNDRNNAVVIDFCNQFLFDFFDYLNSKFRVEQHSVNHHIDGKIYDCQLVEGYKNREEAINLIKRFGYLKCGINYKWANGGIYDSVKVFSVDFKPRFTYEGEIINVSDFEILVISQIQESIDKNLKGFQIIKK